MENYKFNRVVYVKEAGDGAPPKAVVLTGLANKDLLTLHNEICAKLGDEPRKNFANKTVAVEQTWVMLGESIKTKTQRREEKGGAAPAPARRSGGGGAGRTVKFDYPYSGSTKEPKKDSDQEKLIKLLTKGATIAECIKLVENVEMAGTLTMAHPKTWRLMHAVHKNFGYGMRTEGEKITAFAK